MKWYGLLRQTKSLQFFLKTFFHKFYLFHSWIPWPIWKTLWIRLFIFFNLGFLSHTFTIHRTVGEGEAIYLTPLYHFDLIHRRLDISRAIAAKSSPLHIARSRTWTANLWFPSVDWRRLHSSTDFRLQINEGYRLESSVIGKLHQISTIVPQ